MVHLLQEHAHELVVRLHTNATFAEEFAPFFAALPDVEHTFTSELFSDAHLAALQSPALEELVRRERAVTDGVYFGIFQGEKYAAVPQLLGGIAPVPLQAFRHLTALVSSREFAWHRSLAGDEAPQEFLVPLADMLNTDADRINVEQSNDGDKFYLTATKPILKGEELFLRYLPDLDHRNDLSLAGYGFVRKLATPLLPATDLPTFQPHAPYTATPPDDSSFYGPDGAYITHAERARLAALLAAAPTSLAQDQELLEQGPLADWKERVIVEFRVERKKALALAIQAIDARLATSA